MQFTVVITLCFFAVLANCQIQPPLSLPNPSMTVAPLAPQPAFPISPLINSPGPIVPNFAPRFASPLFNPFLNPANNPAIGGIFNTMARSSVMGGLFGKRAAEEVVNKTLCSYTSMKSILNCRGGEVSFECVVKPILSVLGDATFRLSNLTVVPEVVNGVKIYRIVSLTTDLVPEKITLVHPVSHKNILLSLFSSVKITEPGLLVDDSKCWSKFESIIADTTPETVRFSLIITKST
jgi:hypothetical protein